MFEAPQEKFSAKETINGIELVCNWDSGYQDYVMYFPQIEMGSDEAVEKEVNDELFRISEDVEIAKQVFDYAKEVATTDNNVCSVYKKAQAYSNQL